MSERDFRRIERSIENLTKSSTRQIVSGYNRTANRIKKKIADIYEEHGEMSNSTMNKYNRLQKLEKELNKETQKMYNDNRKEINESLRKTFIKTSNEIMITVNKSEQLQLQPITKSKKVTEVINSKVVGLDWRDRMRKHQGDLLYDLKKEIGVSIANGDTYATTAKRLQKTFDIDENKAKTIARNEIARVKSVSQQETLDSIAKEGIEMTKTWRSVADERSRDQHVDMDGVEVPQEDEFTLPDGTKTEGPRLSGVGFHDINCRCYISIDFVKKEKEAELPEIIDPNYESTTEAFESVSYGSKIDKEFAKAIDDRFLDLQNKYPIHEKNITIKTTTAKNRMGHSTTGVRTRKRRGQTYVYYEDEIAISSYHHETKATSLKVHNRNHKVRGSKLKGELTTIDHEYGHAIDNYYQMMKNPELIEARKKFGNGVAVANGDMDIVREANQINKTINSGKGKLSGELYFDLQKELGLTGIEMKKKVSEELGTYATTMHEEFLAEGFANIRHLDDSEKTTFVKKFEELFNNKFDEVIRNGRH